MKSSTDPQGYCSLLFLGGLAALLAGFIFRRNFGVEISLFSAQGFPTEVRSWYILLESHPWLGMFYLGLFDLINAFLLAWMFLALGLILRKTARSGALAALFFGLTGSLTYLITNPLFTLLNLSRTYQAAETEMGRLIALAAGEAVLAVNNPGGVAQGTAGVLFFLFLGAATLITGLVMRGSSLFGKVNAWFGILPGTFDLLYTLILVVFPAGTAVVAGSVLVPLAGLCLMVWHILTGFRLLKLWKQKPC